MFSLYLRSKVWVLSDWICNSKSSPTDKPCCWPMVVAVATVTVPFTLLKEPVRLSVIVSILLSSPAVVWTEVKNRLLVKNPVLILDNPTNSLLNLIQ